MALLDDLRALAPALPPEVKPVAAEVVDVLAGVVHTLETAGIKVPNVVQDVATAAKAATDEPPTVGGAVFDVAGTDQAGAAPPEPAPPAAPDVSSLEDEIRAQQDKLQSLQIKLADAQKTQHTAVNEPV